MSYEPRDLVSHSLRRNHGDLIADLLVRLKVESEFTIVFLDDLSAVVFYGFRSNTSLYIIIVRVSRVVRSSVFFCEEERERETWIDSLYVSCVYFVFCRVESSTLSELSIHRSRRSSRFSMEQNETCSRIRSTHSRISSLYINQEQ